MLYLDLLLYWFNKNIYSLDSLQIPNVLRCKSVIPYSLIPFICLIVPYPLFFARS